MSTKISALPSATTLAGTEVLPVVQAATTVGATVAQVATYASGARGVSVNAQTGTTYTYLIGDRAKLVTHTNAAAIAGTLAVASSFGAGWHMYVENRGAGALTITPTTSTIDGAASLVVPTNNGCLIVSDGTNYFSMRGFAGSFAGGTLSLAMNEAPPVTIASSTNPAIGAAASNTVLITGTTTISGFDTIAAGAIRTTSFAGALTMTHNATSMILLTGVNIVTAAGDSAVWRSLGSGNWTMVSFNRANGAPIGGVAFSAYASVASSLASGGFTKVALGAKDFDIGNSFDTSTSRFQPTTPGYYNVHGTVQAIWTSGQVFGASGVATIYKNGVAYKYGAGGGTNTEVRTNVSAVIFMNGSSDYLELYCYVSAAANTGTGSLSTHFSARL